MKEKICVNKDGLKNLLRQVDTGGFWSIELGIGYFPGQDGVVNVMTAIDYDKYDTKTAHVYKSEQDNIDG